MLADSILDQWLPVALASTVDAKPRQYKLLGQNIVVYRHRYGPAAFKDLCAHRGAALSNGWIADGNLTCPYHGWQYDRNGACVSIPSIAPGEKIPSTAKIAAYPTREAYGIVWVCLSSPAGDLAPWPDEAWEAPGFRVFCTGQYSWDASATRVIENGLDFSHFNFAHKGLTELADGPVIKEHKVKSDDKSLTMTYDDGNIRRDYFVNFPFTLHIRKRVVKKNNSVTWSSNADSEIGDITIVSLIASPVTEEHTSFFGFLSRNHSLEMSDAEFGGNFDSILEQDRVIVESQLPKSIPDDLGSELHVRNADIASVAYRRMFIARRRA